MNIAVCDDEKVIGEQIRNMIKRINPKFTVEVYVSGEELLASGKSFDMALLDIQMEGMNGIDTAKRLRKLSENTMIVFITGSREYVFDAFDVSAFHYLLKPIEEKKFAKVLECASEEVKKRRKLHERERRFLFVKTKRRGITLNIDKIMYIESRSKKVEIHTTDREIELYSTMNELEAQLGEEFYRCHRSYLVNMAYIAEYSNDSIILKNGETVYMAKDKYSEFVKAYMRYLRDEVIVNV